MDFKRLIAMAVTVGSLTIAGCADDTQAGATESTGTGDDTTGAGPTTDPTITTTNPMTTAGMDETGTGTPTTTDPDDGSSSDGGGSGDCCAAHPSAGCENATCSDAVCAMNASCCAFEWNGACADLAEQLCTGCAGGGSESSSSGGDGSSSDDGGNMDQCCTPTPGTPGCPNQLLEDCVCGQDSFCCDTEWDAQCVSGATNLCGANCPVMEGDCCVPGNTAGCLDDTCEAAVCAVDAFCCGNTWDGFCAAAAAGICTDCGAADGDCCAANGMQGCEDDVCVFLLCDNDGAPIDTACCTDAWDQSCADQAATACEVCGGGPGTGDCCAANATAGCEDETCNDAVCAVDPFCCASSWDVTCAAQAAGICGICGAADGDCCTANGMQGCDDDQCVFELCGNDGAPVDATCCTDAWDQACADQAANLCGVCGAIIPSNCCSANGTPGCDDQTCEDAICAADPFCCTDGWDGYCASEAAGFCGTCGGGMGNCCEDNGTPGCNDAQCVVDICGFDGGPVDPSCCSDTWDQACADAAEDAACACNP